MNFCVSILWRLLLIYNFVLLGGIILSWFPMLYNFKIFRMIRRMSDWFMGPFHGYLVLGPLDFTPIVGFMLYDGIVTAISYLMQ